MRRFLAVLAAGFLAAGLLAAGCGSRGSQSNKLTLAGSTAFAPVADKLAKGFQAKNPNVKIDIHSIGSIVGIKSTNEGSCDIGMADVVELPATAASLKSTAISRDGIAVVVHPGNPVKGLTKDQVMKIFDGTFSNWADVGGADHAISVIAREESSGTRSAFDRILGIKGRLTKSAQFQNSNGACQLAVATDPHAIGYVSFVMVDASVHALAVDGVEATIQNVRDGKFPISATDFFLTRGEPTPLAKSFIEFALSPEGQKLIADAGLIPLK
ncbi:MAG: phosphate ABC transporter substrate-binding protein [Planctomycetes bacterium]|nr:phosphate ABC transporter substrate-binding protein [Planctomycetota bacterium]